MDDAVVTLETDMTTEHKATVAEVCFYLGKNNLGRNLKALIR